MKDFYAVLGTDINSTPGNIREAYLKLAKKFHPDLNEYDPYFDNRFREIREAYEVLSDPVSRSAYDDRLKKFSADVPATFAQSKNLTKGSVNTKINWAFTAMLLVITALFGYYVVRSLTHSKTPKVAATSETTIAAITPHHKKHHHQKSNAIKTDIAKIQAKPKPFTDTVSLKTVKPSIPKSLPPAVTVVDKPKPVIVQSTQVVSAKPAEQNVAPAIMSKPAAVSTVSNSAPANGNAFIKANATGVVYMRQMNNYSSDVVTVIPGDTKVAVLEKGSNFSKISYNNKTGYVPNWTVQYR